MDRTGIWDAELARRIPVSRQTLVRWKEGITSRPRHRDDVSRCAELLRLTDGERDELLLAGGFSPEAALPSIDGESPLPDDPEEVPETPPVQQTDASPARRRRVLLVALVASTLVLAAVAAGLALMFRDTTEYPLAVDGESLIVLAPFVNYTAGGQGFNVVGRLRAAVDSELQSADLASVRTVEWPIEIDGAPEAEDAIRRSNAALIIWGEYDSGRVVARFTAPPNGGTSVRGDRVVDIASSPAQLPATINIGLTEEVRYVALATLGQLYLEQDQLDRAKTLLIRALEPPPSEAVALANLRYLLGSAYLGGDLADFDEAIWLFTQVLAVEPRSVEALNSRALAYLERGRVGDPDLAIDDLNRALTIRPERAATHLNLAVAHLERGSYDDIGRALNNLNEAISLRPDYASAYVNRAGAYIARGTADDIDRALDDIETALEIEPELASAHLNRGNAYLARDSDGDTQFAITEFSRAIQLAPDSPLAHFNRGLVYSELGDVSSSLRDLLQAHELSPNDMIYNRTPCRQLGVSGDPEEAWPFCDAAVAYDPDGLARDARGVVNALRGRSKQAIADFEAFLEWVDESPKNSCGSHYRASRIAWIESLSAGDNPFGPSTLFDLRARPVLPDTAPC